MINYLKLHENIVLKHILILLKYLKVVVKSSDFKVVTCVSLNENLPVSHFQFKIAEQLLKRIN